jgi:phage/plasmid primase-like uncharacterized protein
MADAINAFHGAILAALGHAPESIEPGRFQRFSTNGKRSDQSGWCRLFDDGRAGVFGCFRLAVSEVWTETPRERMTPSERADLRRRVAEERAQCEREQQATWRRNADRIAYLWRQCRPVTAGDPVHRYLCSRLALNSFDVPECLRLHPAMAYVHEGEGVGTWPAMVAPLRARDGRVLSLHRTYLEPGGRKADVPGPVKKLTGTAGPLGGASIELHQPERGRIGIAEGIETALAARCASSVPTVAAYCAGNLAAWKWPAGVQRLVIFADADAAGRAAADELRARALAAHLRCEVLTPTDDGADWCDVWAGRGAVLIEAGCAS